MVGHRLVFTPSGRTGEVPAGTTVLAGARALGVDLDSVCGGRGVCGRCQVTVAAGHHAMWSVNVAPEALSPPGPTERDYRGARDLAPGHRLGCAAAVDGDVVIDVPPTSQVHRQVIRKELGNAALAVDPRFRLLYIELPGGDADDLAGAVADQHGITIATDDDALTDVGADATVAIDGEDRLVAAWAGFVATAFGVAVDVGSTTLAAHLVDLFTGDVLASAGAMNPQIRFGEDLMSRVSYVMMNPGGDDELTAVVREAIDGLIGELCVEGGVERDRVLDVVLVANPVMHHLLLGIDPTPLGSAPFTLATDGPVVTAACDLGLDLPHAGAYVGPCIAGHVGADTSAAILAESMHGAGGPRLLVDIGTNAEIVLGHESTLFAASSPTGPAFEGAQLSCGQRATAGAIEHVRIDPQTGEARVKVIGCDLWSDDPGFTDCVTAHGVTGLCGSGIVEVLAEMFLAGIIDGHGTIVARNGFASVIDDGRTRSYVVHAHHGHRVVVTQNDVRAVQLAKAALRAGIDLLTEHAGVVPTDVRLAGAFGAHLSPLHTMVLGLVPDGPIDTLRAVGNAAGVGATQALLSLTARKEMEEAVRSVVKIETATEPRFQELFVAAMAIPHATAPSPHLAELVDLPRPPIATGGRSRRRRSHRQEASP